MTWSLICSNTLEPFLSFWLRQFHLSLAFLDLEMAFGRLHQLFLPSAFPTKPKMTHHLCHSIIITRDNHEDNFGIFSQGFLSSFKLHFCSTIPISLIWNRHPQGPSSSLYGPFDDTIWFLFQNFQALFCVSRNGQKIATFDSWTHSSVLQSPFEPLNILTKLFYSHPQGSFFTLSEPLNVFPSLFIQFFTMAPSSFNFKG